MGPTREWFDPVRFWSNPSSGTMGAALAVSAWLRGARVTAVCGPGCPQLPDGIDRVDVETARDMHKAATDLWPEADVGVCSAAVADFRPRPHAGGKLKKAGRSELELTLEANPDVLASLGGSRREGQKLVGFAAESGDPAAGARDKLQRKGCDMVVGNAVCAFGSADNAVVLVDGHGRVEQWPSLPKTEVAWRIWDHVSLL
jgi:phosphopantothenoylcysteine decarboxylase/phosphopantothenate--cysteine ligase